MARGNNALFVKNGVPVKFFFHKSVTQGRGQITRDVERHGGRIVDDDHLANVVLVDEQQDLVLLRRGYYSSTELYRLSLYVESRGFVQACIRQGAYRHAAPVKHGMPGRAPGARGRGRVPFTEEDKAHLAYYLATRCPTRDGRMGNSAYKDLERLGQTDDVSWAWARRHTFHSWREHYKMNPAMMDTRIDYYLERLKGVGHHLGHDLRRHDHWQLRQEDEDEDASEEEDEDEEEEQRQGVERQDRECRRQVRPVVRRAREYHPRHEQDLASDEEDGDDIQEEEEEGEEAIQELQRVKRNARDLRKAQKTQRKRARVSEASSNKRRASGDEAGRGANSPMRETDSDDEELPEIEGDDLFGDETYGDEPLFEFDNSQDIDSLGPFSHQTSPVPEEDGAPLSTQATLIASPLAAEKEFISAPGPTPTKVVEAQPTVPPSSQQTVVMTQERVVVQRARVRGASAQPGPSEPRKTRTRGGVEVAGVPYRNTRERSRSVDPQPQPEPGSSLAREREDQRGKDKGKAKAALVAIEEDVHVEEAQRDASAEEDAGSVAVSGRLSTRETFEDEMVVEGLLEGSVESAHDGHSDSDGDGDVMPELPRFQEIEIGSEPSDSDDAETHGSLVRGVVGESGGDESDQDQDEDEDEEDADADRIERMANGSLRAAPAPTPTPFEFRITRSMAASQTQTRTHPRISPPRTRSRTGPQQTRAAFPSPGTKARAVVDRVQEDEKRTPYAPPAGSRAAKAVKGRGRRG